MPTQHQLKQSEGLKPFGTNLELTISKLTNSRVVLYFNNSALVQKISSSLYNNLDLNLYIVFELNIWPGNPTNHFPLKTYLLGTVKLVRNSVKHIVTYNGPGKAFDGKGS